VYLLVEGFKETEHTRIEKDKDSESEIEMLYSFGVVIFEHTVLKNDDYEYSICYFSPSDVYDIVVINKKKGCVDYFNSLNDLPEEYQKYYNLINGEKTFDKDGNELICRSHSIEYTL